jgi:methylated-DNA-[protein]-cysteine S-methyltransferase
MTDDRHRITINTPLGSIAIAEQDGAIVALDWHMMDGRDMDGRVGRPTAATPLLRRAADQLAEYFARQRRAFDLPLAPEGSEFQQRVWRRMAQIPYGKTMTYGDMAHAIGSAPRAVGGACGRNPIAIVIPCHRVIGGSGALTGYSGAGGVNTKQFLLELEGALTPGFRISA